MNRPLRELLNDPFYYQNQLVADQISGRNRPRQPMLTVKPANDDAEFYADIAQFNPRIIEIWQRADEMYRGRDEPVRALTPLEPPPER